MRIANSQENHKEVHVKVSTTNSQVMYNKEPYIYVE